LYGEKLYSYGVTVKIERLQPPSFLPPMTRNHHNTLLRDREIGEGKQGLTKIEGGES